ncbi:MAG: NlpB/DapX lipoprotein [Gammaproteobacteria bacterium]|nr:NlpB/DapX lipoprotein [Gammaproteobacteria bacterium]
MNKIIGFSLIAGSVLLLSGCAHAFRNRAYDYTTQDVQQTPPVQIPSSVTAPNFQPALTVPPGPMNYPPSAIPAMTPPYYGDTYKLNNKTKQATLVSSANPNAQAPIIAQPATMKSQAAAAAARQSSSALSLPSQIVRTEKNVPVLEVTAPFDMTWKQMSIALQKSGFRVVNAEQQSGYYFITLAGDDNNADAVLLYLKQNQNITQVILYTSAGNPDSSNNAYSTLQQLGKNL